MCSWLSDCTYVTVPLGNFTGSALDTMPTCDSYAPASEDIGTDMRLMGTPS